MEVWQTIKDAQDAKGWTNQKLAEKSGVPEPTLQKFLTGKTLDPRFDNVVRLCRALDISVDHLCGIDSNSSVAEIAELRYALTIEQVKTEAAEAQKNAALAQQKVAETKLEAQIHEYNQMLDAYEYRIHISKDRVIWLRNFLIFTCALITLFIIAFITFILIDVSNSDIGWLRSMSLYIGGYPHAKCCNICSFFFV